MKEAVLPQRRERITDSRVDVECVTRLASHQRQTYAPSHML